MFAGLMECTLSKMAAHASSSGTTSMELGKNGNAFQGWNLSKGATGVRDRVNVPRSDDHMMCDAVNISRFGNAQRERERKNFHGKGRAHQ
jgi:hypothetical protein